VPLAWADNDHLVPLWTYFAFLQNFPMALHDTVGAHWIAPTWTLAVEEHFYLVIPSLIVFTPRRYLVNVLLAFVPVALALRVAIFKFQVLPFMWGWVMLPCRFDMLVCGLLAGYLVQTNANMKPYLFAIRLTPLLALVATFVIRAVGGASNFDIYGPLFMGVGIAAFILCLVLDAPEGARFKSPLLQKIGDNTYCLYLVHLAVLGLMHGLILGTQPDIATGAQWAVTLAALPVTGMLTFLMTKYVEMPITGYGRAWKWSKNLRKNLETPEALPV
jgi:peptidoglycan/LPS O-acetylase OafA/YrhL